MTRLNQSAQNVGFFSPDYAGPELPKLLDNGALDSLDFGLLKCLPFNWLRRTGRSAAEPPWYRPFVFLA